MERFEMWWGSGEDIGVIAMSVRAICAFFIMLFLIRIAGMRIFSKQSAFDSILSIMLGAILSRGVVGASHFLSTVAACVVMVLIHRLISVLCVKFSWLGKIFKGGPLLLYEDGKYVETNMHTGGISKNDIKDALRIELNEEDLSRISKVYMERNGQLSFVKSIHP